MMNRRIFNCSLISLSILALFAWSCSTTQVQVKTSNPTIEISDYATFSFFELEAEGDTSSVFNESMAYFKSEVTRQMNVRGVSHDTDSPDLKINLGIVVEEKTQTRQTSLSDPGEWTSIGQRNYKWESKTGEVGPYKEGSITIHLVDNSSNEAIWIGLIEGVLPRKPEKRKESIRKAVASLFSEIDQSSTGAVK